MEETGGSFTGREFSARVPWGGSSTPALDLTLTAKLNLLLLPPLLSTVTRLARSFTCLIAAALWDKLERRQTESIEHDANWQHALPTCCLSTRLPLICTPATPNPPICTSIAACMLLDLFLTNFIPYLLANLFLPRQTIGRWCKMSCDLLFQLNSSLFVLSWTKTRGFQSFPLQLSNLQEQESGKKTT